MALDNVGLRDGIGLSAIPLEDTFYNQDSSITGGGYGKVIVN
jgi:hypothetical protein